MRREDMANTAPHVMTHISLTWIHPMSPHLGLGVLVLDCLRLAGADTGSTGSFLLPAGVSDPSCKLLKKETLGKGKAFSNKMAYIGHLRQQLFANYIKEIECSFWQREKFNSYIKRL